MCGFGIDYAHGEKRRDANAGGCGSVGYGPGARLPDARALPLLLPRHDDRLRYGDGWRGSLLLPVAFLQHGPTAGARRCA